MDHAAGQAMEPPRRRPATWHESRRPGGSRHAAMRGTGRMGGPPARYIRKLPTCARCRSAACSLPEAPRREATALAPASQAQQPLGAGRPLDGTGSRSRGLEHEGGRHPPWTAAVAAASAKGHATALARRIARNSRKTRKRYAHVPPGKATVGTCRDREGLQAATPDRGRPRPIFCSTWFPEAVPRRAMSRSRGTAAGLPGRATGSRAHLGGI
jgi:hypothetical protein